MIEKVLFWMRSHHVVFHSITLIVKDSVGDVIKNEFKRNVSLDLSLKEERVKIEDKLESKKRKLELIDDVIKKRQATPIQTDDYEIQYQGFTWEISSEQSGGFCKTCKKEKNIEWCIHDGLTEDKICIHCIQRIALRRRNILYGWDRIQCNERDKDHFRCDYCEKIMFKDYFRRKNDYKDIRCCQKCVDLFVEKDFTIPLLPKSIHEIFTTEEK